MLKNKLWMIVVFLFCVLAPAAYSEEISQNAETAGSETESQETDGRFQSLESAGSAVFPIDVTANFGVAAGFNAKPPLRFSATAAARLAWFVDVKTGLKIDSQSFNFLLLGRFTPVDIEHFALQFDARFHYAALYPYKAHDVGGVGIVSFLFSSKKHPVNRFTFDLSIGWKFTRSISNSGNGKDSFFKHMPILKLGFNMRFLESWKIGFVIETFNDWEYRQPICPSFNLALGYRMDKHNYVELSGYITYTDMYYCSGTTNGWGLTVSYTRSISPLDEVREVYR